MALLFSPAAVKGLGAMPAKESRQMYRRLMDIAAAPRERHPGVIAMQGQPSGRFGVRQGDWRAIFSVSEGGDVVVHEVGHRSEVYR